MNNICPTNEYRRESISFSCIVVSFVFFLVLFQAPILRLPEIATQVFRPIIVFFLLIRMTQKGKIDFSARTIALVAAIYCAFDLLLVKINGDEIMKAAAVILYLLMFCAITGTSWNRREVSFIIFACFIGAFACAVAILMSNNPTDFHTGANNQMQMLGMYVNRNKNAYAFSIGTLIGISYLLYGKNRSKFFVALVTAVIGYALLYSQCRGAFFCTVAGVVIVVAGMLLKIRKQNPSKFLAYSVLFILLCVTAYFLLKNSPLNRLIDGDTSGRDDGIEYAWQLFRNGDIFNKVFGFGYLYETEHTVGAISHTVYTNFLLSTGLIGAGLIVLLLLCSYKRIKGSLAYAFFAGAFLRTFFEILDYYIYIPLILSIIIFNYSKVYKRPESDVFCR